MLPVPTWNVNLISESRIKIILFCFLFQASRNVGGRNDAVRSAATLFEFARTESGTKQVVPIVQ